MISIQVVVVVVVASAAAVASGVSWICHSGRSCFYVVPFDDVAVVAAADTTLVPV